MKVFSKVAALSCLLMLSRCREPIDFVETGLPFVLVVSGEVKSGFSLQELSITAYKETVQTRVIDARVSVNEYNTMGELQNSFPFEYVDFKGGVYQSPFEGKVGNSYELVIETENTCYQSTRERMLPVAKIDTITGKDFFSDDGRVFAQIEVSASSLSTEDSRYFLWEFTETYEIRVPYPSSYFWENGPNRRNEPVGPCWKSNKSFELLIASTADLTENRISKFPVRIISNINQELRTRYSINIFQKSLSEEAYLYYQRLQKIANRTGSLSDIQPGNILGNIQDSNGNYAIGYFIATQEASKRAFFRPTDFESIVNVEFKYWCEPLILNAGELFDFMNEGNNQYNYLIHQFYDQIGWFVLRKECSDCSSYASNIKPDYWE